MATNPNRPAYLDTIASPWGQQVADHVIRRYATPAARDADLAAITAADLKGQVVAILADGTFLPYLMMHNGAGWSPLLTGSDTQSGDYNVGYDANGYGTVTYGHPFGAAGHIVAAAGSGSTTALAIQVWAGAAASATLRAFQLGGAVQTGVYPTSWIAHGSPAQLALLARIDEIERPSDFPLSWPGKREDGPADAVAYLDEIDRVLGLSA